MAELKTNTVLQYDDDFKEVKSWGYPALYNKQSKKNKNKEKRPVELFKLYLGNCLKKPKLPVPYKQAITDYLRELGKVNNNKKKIFLNFDFQHYNNFFFLNFLFI